MQSLKILPNIKYLLENNKEQEAISIINPNIDTLALYMKDLISLFSASTPESLLCLSKIHFILQDYEVSIDYAIKSGEIFLKEKSFYSKALIERMMSRLLLDNNHKCKDFIINLITNINNNNNDNDLDDLDRIGFLFSIGELDLFEKYFSKQITNKSLLNFIYNEIEDKERFYKFIIKNQNKENYDTLCVLVDAYMYFNSLNEIKKLLLELLCSDISLCYSLSFYIQETHNLPNIIDNNINDNNNSSDLDCLMLILSGQFKKEVFTKFMVQENLTSFKFLDSLAKSRSPYISLVNSLMNLGTTNDTFYRNNSDIFGNLKEWSRYSDISNLGMIHFKNDNPYEILKNYIPNESSALYTKKEDRSSTYKETTSGSSTSGSSYGGSLQALGLINHCTYNEVDNELLLYFIESDEFLSEDLVFGVCMGLGLINLGSNNQFIVDKLKKMIKFKNTIYNEAAVLGLGLIGCGTGDDNLMAYLEEINKTTEYERVKRSISISQSLLQSFNTTNICINVSNSTSNSLNNTIKYDNTNILHNTIKYDNTNISNRLSVLSWGTMYVGTGNLLVISKILPFINNENDDIKRNAVISLGLVCCLDRDLLISTLEPLAENHNMSVRAGVGVTLGFFFSGTGNNKVCDLLEGLIYDSCPLVRQSALIGIGLVLMQCNDHLVKNYKRIINRINKIIIDRSEENSVKFGAMLGRGLSEAGGRNIIFSITNLCNKITKERICGAVLFLNYWYWYPFINLISLNMKETGFFVFDQNLDLQERNVKYNKNYDNELIKVPDLKKSRKFKARPVVEEEKISKADEEIRSGGRCTLLQMEETGLNFPGVYFIKK